MRTFLFILAATAALTATIPAPAHCARGLLYLGGLTQSLEVEYDYLASEFKNENSSSSSSEHAIDEKYKMDFSYAIYKPSIWKGDMGLGVRFNQAVYGATGTESAFTQGIDLQYRISGKIVERKPYPVLFYVGSETVHVQNPNSVSYDMQNNIINVSFLYKNKNFPFRANFNQSSQTVKAGGKKQEQEVDQLSMNVSNATKQTSTTLSLSGSRSTNSSEGSSSKNENFSVGFGNHVSLVDKKQTVQRYLDTRYTGYMSRGTDDENSHQGEVGLHWDLGKALQTSLRYGKLFRKSVYTREKEDVVQADVSHRLFDSLYSSLSVYGRRNAMDEGTIVDASGSARVGYRKKLPLNGSMGLSYGFLQGITDRSTFSSTIPVSREEHAADFSFTLNHENIDLTSLVIKNGNSSSIGYGQTLIEGEEYFAESDGVTVTVYVFPSINVDIGDLLLVSYSYGVVSPAAKYARYTHSLSGTLSLFSERLSLSASRDNTKYSLKKGLPEDFAFDPTSATRFSLNLRSEALEGRAIFTTIETGEEKRDILEGGLKYRMDVGETFLTFNLTDRYTTATRENGRNRSENSALATVSATRTIGYSVVKGTATYHNMSGTGAQRNEASFLGTISTRIHKLVAVVSASVRWREIGGMTSMSQEIRLSLTRYF